MIIIKNPLIFLYKIKHKFKFTNNELEIILGYFIEKNIEVAVYNDIREIINNYKINSVNKFYKLLSYVLRYCKTCICCSDSDTTFDD